MVSNSFKQVGSSSTARTRIPTGNLSFSDPKLALISSTVILGRAISKTQTAVYTKTRNENAKVGVLSIETGGQLFSEEACAYSIIEQWTFKTHPTTFFSSPSVWQEARAYDQNVVFIQNDRSSWICWHGFHPMPLCWKDYSQSRGGVLSIGKLQQENLNKIWVRMILYCSKCYRYGNFPFVGIHLHQNNSFIWLGKVRDSRGPITRFQPTSIKLRP